MIIIRYLHISPFGQNIQFITDYDITILSESLLNVINKIDLANNTDSLSEKYQMTIKDIIKNICCFTTQCCKGQCIGLSRNQNIKLTYNIIIILGYIMSNIMALIFANYQNLSKDLFCQHQYINDLQGCVNQEILWRVMFSISIVFLILGACMFLRSEAAKIINQGTWMIKLLFIIILSIIFIDFIPDYLIKFEEISIYFLVIYYFLQSLVVIDGIYSIDRFFNSMMEDSINNTFVIVKAAFSILCTILAIGLNFLSYYYSIFQLSICNSIIMMLLLVVVFLRIFKGFNLLIWGCFSLYINIFLFLVHDQSVAEQDKKYHIIDGGDYAIQLIFTIVFLMGILMTGSNKIRTPKSSLNQILALNTNKQQEDARYVSSNKWIVYHFVMFFIVLSLPMALNLSGNTMISHEYGQVLMVIRAISLILIYIVFGWTLLASKLFPDRDFSELENYFREFQLN